MLWLFFLLFAGTFGTSFHKLELWNKNSNVLVTYSLWISAESYKIQSELSVSFDFRTVQQNGVILSISSVLNFPALALEMHDGKVYKVILIYDSVHQTRDIYILILLTCITWFYVKQNIRETKKWCLFQSANFSMVMEDSSLKVMLSDLATLVYNL